jgi:hypothetical protein
VEAARPLSMEDQIRLRTPVAAPAEQQAQVAALSKALDRMLHPPKRRAPKCQLVGPKGKSIPLPESVFYVLERVAEAALWVDRMTLPAEPRRSERGARGDPLHLGRGALSFDQASPTPDPLGAIPPRWLDSWGKGLRSRDGRDFSGPCVR